MMKFYRYPFFIVTLAMLFFFQTNVKAFVDVSPSDWFFLPVQEGVNKGYIYNTAYFYPDRDLKRAEMAKLVVESLGLKEDTSAPFIPFNDVPETAWFYQPIKILKSLHIAEGYSGGSFGPNDMVTREQVAKIIYLAAKLSPAKNSDFHFSDVSQNRWSYIFIEKLYELKVLQGFSDGSYRPTEQMNRAEVATVISRLLKALKIPSSSPKIPTSTSGPSTSGPSTSGPSTSGPSTSDPSTQNQAPASSAQNQTPVSIPEPTVDHAFDDVRSAFETLQNDTFFPIDGGSVDLLEYSFGPRKLNNSYDWHRGIDLDVPLGTPVHSAYDGELVKIDFNAGTGGGITVYIKHTFPNPPTYQGKTLNNFYTLYMHLDTVTPDLETAAQQEQHPFIAKGDIIGTAGDSGANTEHLHMDLRIGTYCSLEYQLNNPSSTCAQYGFDPHIHPLYLFPPFTPSVMNMTVSGTPVKTQDTTVHFTSPRNQALINRIEYQLINKISGAVVASHIMNFDRRIGFNASTNSLLDSQDKSKPYITPYSVPEMNAAGSNLYLTDIIIPTTFVQNLDGDLSVVTITDIWGATKTIQWTW